MNKLFEIEDLKFYKEEFLDDISEFEDIIPIIQELSPHLKYEEIEVSGLNDCCNEVNKNYIIEIHGFIDEEDNFITKEELLDSKDEKRQGGLDIFIIRIYKCLNCSKWIIDILE
ncbi:hypothetical protein [Clostridium sp.]|uniref:hypothetical protein n=1 Tax=Clostridium sp. TaxID=1506 RepID=UPI0026152CB8|nr:hypothetical protein [Clostridium sp.]